MIDRTWPAAKKRAKLLPSLFGEMWRSPQTFPIVSVTGRFPVLNLFGSWALYAFGFHLPSAFFST
jgi:hypothetical protein